MYDGRRRAGSVKSRRASRRAYTHADRMQIVILCCFITIRAVVAGADYGQVESVRTGCEVRLTCHTATSRIRTTGRRYSVLIGSGPPLPPSAVFGPPAAVVCPSADRRLSTRRVLCSVRVPREKKHACFGSGVVKNPRGFRSFLYYINARR